MMTIDVKIHTWVALNIRKKVTNSYNIQTNNQYLSVVVLRCFRCSLQINLAIFSQLFHGYKAIVLQVIISNGHQNTEQNFYGPKQTITQLELRVGYKL